MDPEAREALERALPSSVISDDADDLRACSGDASGAESVLPEAVVRPRTTAQVSSLMRWATAHGVPVSPRGAGTGKSGGCVPSQGGVVLSLAEMNRLLDVRPEHGWAEVEPGLVTGRFRDEVQEAHRLFYPPDPGSLDTCTLGGNVATNAGGPVALKYGVTGNFVLGVEAVLGDGRVVELGRRQPKSVAGYDLTSLIVGSEGTLGVITRIRLRLMPRPREVVAALLPFASVRSACDAVLSARRSGLSPRAIELFDGACLERAGREPLFPYQKDWGALLLVEFDGEEGTVRPALERFASQLESDPPLEVRIVEGEGRRSLWAVRRKTSEWVKRGATGWITEDIAVPLGAMPAVLDALPAIGEANRLSVFGYGHAGDGNLHINILWEDPDGAARAKVAAEAVIRLALEFGGTISGEHGIGLLKRSFLPWEQSSELLGVQRSIKAVLDPAGVLNPSKIFS